MPSPFVSSYPGMPRNAAPIATYDDPDPLDVPRFRVVSKPGSVLVTTGWAVLGAMVLGIIALNKNLLLWSDLVPWVVIPISTVGVMLILEGRDRGARARAGIVIEHSGRIAAQNEQIIAQNAEISAQNEQLLGALTASPQRGLPKYDTMDLTVVAQRVREHFKRREAEDLAAVANPDVVDLDTVRSLRNIGEKLNANQLEDH